MPVHEFSPLKKIEDAEKEIEEGKAKELPKQIFQERIMSKPSEIKTEKKQISHPLIHGSLEITEEEL